MMQKKLQVFISSTYDDMKKERQAAVEAVLEAGHIPAGMELFSAGSSEQLEIIKRWIDMSDVYMLLLGGRYGSIEPMTGLSYIECEYEYARKKGMPLFSLVISDSFLDKKVREFGRDVIESSSTEKYNIFKTKILSKLCAFFDDLPSLQKETIKSLNEIQKRHHLIGWLRADLPNFGLVGDVEYYYYPFLDPMKYKLGNIIENKQIDNSWNSHIFCGDFKKCGDIRWIYGPYRKLPCKGKYRVTYKIRLEKLNDTNLKQQTKIVVLDAYDYFGGQKTYSERTLALKDLDFRFKKFHLFFAYDDINTVLEYRVGIFADQKQFSISLDSIKVKRWIDEDG